MNTWSIVGAIDAEDPMRLACPRCTEAQMRYTGHASDRGGLVVVFVCSSCEQRAEMHFETGRAETRVTWRWS